MIKANIVTGLADLAEAAYVKFGNEAAAGLAAEQLKDALRDPDFEMVRTLPGTRTVTSIAVRSITAGFNSKRNHRFIAL